MNADFNISKSGQLANILCKVSHFKKALREFSFLSENELICLKFSRSYPMLQLVFGEENMHRYHVIKFNERNEDFIFKEVSETQSYYNIESLRLAFNRISSDDLFCYVTL